VVFKACKVEVIHDKDRGEATGLLDSQAKSGHFCYMDKYCTAFLNSLFPTSCTSCVLVNTEFGCDTILFGM
jgi:hypothetical protein